VDEANPGRNRETLLFQTVLGQYDAPAFVRRARRVAEAFEELLDRCRTKRVEWLRFVRADLRVLRAMAGEWSLLRPLLAGDEDVAALAQLEALVSPPPPQVVPPATPRKLRRTLEALRRSVSRFNERWRQFLPTVDLTEVNAERDGYNRYYLLEKECAVRSARVAREGFRPLPPLTAADLEAALPLLPLPRLA
jgi:hypothetical protein